MIGRNGGGGWTRTNDLRPGTALLFRLRKAEPVALRIGKSFVFSQGGL